MDCMLPKQLLLSKYFKGVTGENEDNFASEDLREFSLNICEIWSFCELTKEFTAVLYLELFE